MNNLLTFLPARHLTTSTWSVHWSHCRALTGRLTSRRRLTGIAVGKIMQSTGAKPGWCVRPDMFCHDPLTVAAVAVEQWCTGSCHCYRELCTLPEIFLTCRHGERKGHKAFILWNIHMAANISVQCYTAGVNGQFFPQRYFPSWLARSRRGVNSKKDGMEKSKALWGAVTPEKTTFIICKQCIETRFTLRNARVRWLLYKVPQCLNMRH